MKRTLLSQVTFSYLFLSLDREKKTGLITKLAFKNLVFFVTPLPRENLREI